MEYRKLWIALAVVISGSFIVLGSAGYKMISGPPPIPERVIASNGDLFLTGEQITNGQNVWQSIGGQQIGSDVFSC